MKQGVPCILPRCWLRGIPQTPIPQTLRCRCYRITPRPLLRALDCLCCSRQNAECALIVGLG